MTGRWTERSGHGQVLVSQPRLSTESGSTPQLRCGGYGGRPLPDPWLQEIASAVVFCTPSLLHRQPPHGAERIREGPALLERDCRLTGASPAVKPPEVYLALSVETASFSRPQSFAGGHRLASRSLAPQILRPWRAARTPKHGRPTRSVQEESVDCLFGGSERTKENLAPRLSDPAFGLQSAWARVRHSPRKEEPCRSDPFDSW